MDIDLEKFHILYVEDDEVDAMHAVREFQKLNPKIKVKIAKDSFEAQKFLQDYKNNPENLPKIILLDNFLPKMKGIEFLAYLRAHPEYSKIRVFLLTSLYSSKDKIAIDNLDVSGCIVKPLKHADALNIMWFMNSDMQNAQVLFNSLE